MKVLNLYEEEVYSSSERFTLPYPSEHDLLFSVSRLILASKTSHPRSFYVCLSPPKKPETPLKGLLNSSLSLQTVQLYFFFLAFVPGFPI